MKLAIFILFLSLICSCAPNFEEPAISLEDYQIEEGFDLELIASEPLLKAPVAIDFDAKGRIWVAQMPGYMSDMQGSQEDEPIGSIVILEDKDQDGRADHVKPFLDSLVMPRALAHVYGGLLYATPPFLYFVEIKDDKPVNRVVVDSLYAAEGNPEHQPNGLLLNIDNWIYNAKSNFRYQRKNGLWIKEPTSFRGQWGISHDNFGRLYYNNNSRQLLGDHVLPNRIIKNKYATPKLGVNQTLTKDQRVYPLHATTVNRGYAPGVLNADSILVNTTAAAGLVVYRGGNFPKDYDQNVFVSIPEANLIKRNLLSFKDDVTLAKQAWQGKEFLAATDEGFRPVTLKNGPDGSLYIVDMHRGMIGHHAYLSPYLKKKNELVRLDTITDYGRILKVTSANNVARVAPNFETLSGSELVALLANENGWIRDRAQHYLVFKKHTEMLPKLKEIALDTTNALAQIHALHTLSGLDGLAFDLLVTLSEKSNAAVASHAVLLLEQFASKKHSAKTAALFTNLLGRNDKMLDLYIANSIGTWLPHSTSAFVKHVVLMLEKHQRAPMLREALIGGLKDGGISLKAALKKITHFKDQELLLSLSESVVNKEKNTLNNIYTRKSLGEDNRTAGAKMFFQICASCHGVNGEGIEGLAPPLMNSEHVADVERLALIILHGLEGPIRVKGKQYQFNLAMPGLVRNATITDKDIADVMAYVNNAFSSTPAYLSKDKIGELRTLIPKSGAEYTEEELLEYTKKHPSMVKEIKLN